MVDLVTCNISLLDIVARATGLAEWLATEPENPDAAPDEDLAAARLERWSQMAAGGDAALFEQRLARLGLNRETARKRLGQPFPRPLILPGWAMTLQAVFETAGKCCTRGLFRAPFP